MSTTLLRALQNIAPLSRGAQDGAQARFPRLAMAPRSLGRIECLAVQMAGITGVPRPRIKSPVLLLLAGDHGIAAHGVSTLSASATVHQLSNFISGGGAINALTSEAGAKLVVADFGVAAFTTHHRGLQNWRVGPGTRDFSIEPAMTRAEAEMSVDRGIQLVEREIDRGADLIALGDLGAANATSAAAIGCALLERAPADFCAARDPEDAPRAALRARVIEAGLGRHRPDATDAFDVLAKVGGFEIGGLIGVILGAAMRRVPVLLDGLVSTAAALLACRLAPAVRERLIPAHLSAEPGHALLLQSLGVEPLLSLGLTLGEGGGAALAIPLCRAALRMLDEVATFDEAGVPWVA